MDANSRKPYNRPIVVSVAPDTPLERRLAVVWLLAEGERMTSGAVARLTGVTQRSAQRMLAGMSRMQPIRRGEDGCWEWCGRGG